MGKHGFYAMTQQESQTLRYVAGSFDEAPVPMLSSEFVISHLNRATRTAQTSSSRPVHRDLGARDRPGGAWTRYLEAVKRGYAGDLAPLAEVFAEALERSERGRKPLAPSKTEEP